MEVHDGKWVWAVGMSMAQRLAFGVGQVSYLMPQGDGYEVSRGCKGEETLLGQGTATWAGGGCWKVRGAQGSGPLASPLTAATLPATAACAPGDIVQRRLSQWL